VIGRVGITEREVRRHSIDWLRTVAKEFAGVGERDADDPFDDPTLESWSA
jgi:hypothetical protein